MRVVQRPSSVPPKDLSQVTITISGIPEQLLREIDAQARKEKRNRSNFLRHRIEEMLAAHRPVSRTRKAA